MDSSEAFARKLDADDELAHFRDRFVIDDPDLIYLDGNSLGRLPKATQERLRRAIDHEWGSRLVRAWGEGWIDIPSRLGGKIAGVVGAKPSEVLVADSTSVDLFKLAMAALTSTGKREIVTDDLNFPSDVYVLEGCARLVGGQVRVLTSRGRLAIDPSEYAAAIGPDTGLLSLSHVTFKSGALNDMAAITAAAHEAGALVLWDLSHSVGAVPIDLNGCGVDLAVGCTYKYLNGGPGAPAFLYVREALQESLLSPIWGWFGQLQPFAFGLEYAPARGIQRFNAGTPPILSMAAVAAGVDLILEAGMERLRRKSLAQTGYLISLWEELLSPLGVTLNSPREGADRGSHISLGHPEALRIDRALIEVMNVVPDFRYPDNIRFGVTPLYTTFAEIREAVVRMAKVIEERIFERFPLEAPAVT